MQNYAIPEAAEFWADGQEIEAMLLDWDTDENKHRQEELIAAWVGNIDTVADIGCGSGRYACLLDFNLYYFGFDSSHHMLANTPTQDGCTFTSVDIFNFTDNNHYDVVMMIDVAQHQANPLEAISRILELWNADRYIFSLLIGEEREQLLLSTVEKVEDVENMLSFLDVTRTLVEPYEGFSWLLFETTGYLGE